MTDDIADRARRRTRKVLATAVAVIVTLVAVVVGLTAGLGHRGDQVPQPAALPTTGPAVDAAPGRGADHPTPIRDVTFMTVNGMRVPVSRPAGPRDTTAGRARGFSHDPGGAVFAAMHLVLRVAPVIGPAVFGPTLREQVVGGDAAAFRDQVEADYERMRQQHDLSYGAPIGHFASTLLGYRVDSYTPSLVALRLLVEGPDPDGGPVTVAVVIEVRWVDGDWALVAPPAGDWEHAVSVASSSTGFTPLPRER